MITSLREDRWFKRYLIVVTTFLILWCLIRPSVIKIVCYYQTREAYRNEKKQDRKLNTEHYYKVLTRKYGL